MFIEYYYISNYLGFLFCIVNIILIHIQGNSGEIFWMIYKFQSSAKYYINIPQLDWQFVYNILYIAGSGFPVAWFSMWR